MAPLRRYLRITPHSILEVRIYLDNPADLHRWLIHPSHPVLPSVLAAVKPLVLPKLREENARAAGRKAGSGVAKPKGRKAVLDRVVTDAFEVSIFLTELSTPHSVLVRTREFTAKTEPNAGSGPGTSDEPMIVPEEPDSESDPGASLEPVRNENGNGAGEGDVHFLRSEARMVQPHQHSVKAEDDEGMAHDQDDTLSISSSSDHDGAGEEKKKLSLSTTYDGFQIYGRILCLTVKRKDMRSNVAASNTARVSTAASTTAKGKNSSPAKTKTAESRLAVGTETVAEMVQRTAAASNGGGREEGIMESWMRSTQEREAGDAQVDNDENPGDEVVDETAATVE